MCLEDVYTCSNTHELALVVQDFSDAYKVCPQRLIRKWVLCGAGKMAHKHANYSCERRRLRHDGHEAGFHLKEFYPHHACSHRGWQAGTLPSFSYALPQYLLRMPRTCHSLHSSRKLHALTMHCSWHARPLRPSSRELHALTMHGPCQDGTRYSVFFRCSTDESREFSAHKFPRVKCAMA